MTTYRDPMPDPFTQAAVDALAARETREQAREAAWQAGRAEALRAIAAFDVAVAPACLRIDDGRSTVDDMRNSYSTVYLARSTRTCELAYTIWRGDGWATGQDASTFAEMLLKAMKESRFADALAKMQRVDFVDEVAAPSPSPAPKRRSTRVVASVVFIILLAVVSLVLAIALRQAIAVTFG